MTSNETQIQIRLCRLANVTCKIHDRANDNRKNPENHVAAIRKLLFFVTRFARDIGQSAKIWIWVSSDSEVISRWLLHYLLHRADEIRQGRNSCPRLQFLAFSLDSIMSLLRLAFYAVSALHHCFLVFLLFDQPFRLFFLPLFLKTVNSIFLLMQATCSFFPVLLLSVPFALHILSGCHKKLSVNYGLSLDQS